MKILSGWFGLGKAGPTAPPPEKFPTPPADRPLEQYQATPQNSVAAPPLPQPVANPALQWLDSLPPTSPKATAPPPSTSPPQTLLMQETSGPYSPDNPPPARLLGEKLYAIHATNYLPAAGVMKAACRDISGDGPEVGNEPPSFRPTLHFSLGEMVQPHGRSSWDDTKFAVMIPLGQLKDQLANVNPYDTFVVGDLKLPEGSLVLIPDDQPRPDMPPGVQVKTYPSGQPLRKAIDQAVSDADGWALRMTPGGVSNDDKATLEGVEINSSHFFQPFLADCPQAAFGTHTYSAQGQAFRFGGIEQCIDKLAKGFKQYSWSDPSVRPLFRGLIDHHLAKLDQSMQAFPPVSQEAYQNKRTRLEGWLRLVDLDSQVQKQHGKTLRGSDLSPELSKLRDQPEALQAYVQAHLSQFPAAPEAQAVSPAMAAQTLASMPPQEVREFCSQHPEALQGVDMPDLFARYAVKRSLLIEDQQAQQEGLDSLLTTSLGQLQGSDHPLSDELEPYLRTQSNQLDHALELMRRPAVQAYLSDKEGLALAPGQPTQLDQVIQADTKCRELFASGPSGPTSPMEQIGVEILTKVGHDFPQSTKTPQSLSEARHNAQDIRWAQEDLKVNLKALNQPLNSARNLDDVMPGDQLTIYEQMIQSRQDVGKALGRPEQFAARFPTPESLYASPKSLMQVYMELSA